jgi:DNA-binding HxlR family transcriptional regulator
MPGTEIATSFSSARMTEIADLIKALPETTGDEQHNSVTIKMAEEIFKATPKTHIKRAKMIDQLTLSRRLSALARRCLVEKRPGHVGPLPEGKRSYERSSA